ncbi:MAG: DUF389 domain-containing protein [Planctomycetota bacterium]
MSRSLLVLFQPAGCRTIPLATRIAAANGDSLAILCVGKEDAPRLEQVEPDAEDLPDLVRAALAAVADIETGRPEVYDARGAKPRRTVLDAARELGADSLILNDHREPNSARATVQKLARVAPQDVLLLDVGALTEAPRRCVVPQVGGGGGFAIRLAARSFAGAGCPVLVLADAAAAARSSRVFAKTRDRLAEARREFVTQEVVQDGLADALATRVAAGDLVLVEANEARRVSGLLAMLGRVREQRPDAPFAIGLTRAAEAAGPGRIGRAMERVRLHLPTLDREQRRRVHETLERGGSLSTDFVVMLMLSAAIAALGLVQSSTGVVIGAMLVAPLMTPMVAAGMALVQVNWQLFRASLVAMTSGIGGALLAAAFVGWLSPWSDLSSEIVGRGSPNLFDMGIALLSGCAAAFALARPGLAGTLVGVAIAVALVPPLASVAIATVKGAFGIAGGAAVLFLTNLLAIIGGASLVFRLFGLDAARRGQPSPRWVRVVFACMLLGLTPITVVLVQNLRQQIHQGVQRPWAHPLPPALRAAIEARAAHTPGVDVVMMVRSGIENGFGLQVVLACRAAVDPTLEGDLRALVEREIGAGTPVRITALRVADSAR